MIKAHIAEKLSAALKSADITESAILERPNNMAHGDYTTAVAMKLAKQLKKNPMEIAGLIVTHITADQIIEKVEILKPGFINFWVTKSQLIYNLSYILDKKELYGRKNFNKQRKTLLEYGQPNTHKMPHIGHLFSYIFGESLARVLENDGNKIIRLNYQGDIGLHVAKCLYKFLKEPEYFDRFLKSDLAEKVRMLQLSYQYGSKAYDDNTNTKNEINIINNDLYNNKGYLKNLYSTTRKASTDFYQLFEKQYLEIVYDKSYFESDTHSIGKQIVKEYLGSVFNESQGAVIFKGEEYKLHTRVFINQFDNPTYEAKDLGLISLKQKDYPDFDLSIVTTANEQNEYWKVIETTTEMIFPKLKGKIKHIGYGLINLSSGKMSSRSGNILDAQSLIEAVNSEISKNYDAVAVDVGENPFIDHKLIALSAIKYSFLKSEARQNKTFDIEKSIARSGDSGPYLLYTVVRCEKLWRGISLPVTDNTELNDMELTILRNLFHYEEIVENAAESYSPHLVAGYLYDLAKSFNQLYQDQKYVIRGNNFRLKLAKAVAQILKNGLYLLGIKTVQKM